MSSKYIVRVPIKDRDNHIIGYEIQYYGENHAFGGEESTSNDFAAADTIYNFLTLNTDKLLRGTLNFMTFTTTLLMKKSPACSTRTSWSSRSTTASSFTRWPCT